MRYVAANKLGLSYLCMLALFLMIGTAVPASKCDCPEKPEGPGGGVVCESDQWAECDGTSGECNCKCKKDKASQGKTKREYIAFVFADILNREITAEDLDNPEFVQNVAIFLDTGKTTGQFLVQGIRFTPEGKRQNVKVFVGLPEWLEKVLLSEGDLKRS